MTLKVVKKEYKAFVSDLIVKEGNLNLLYKVKNVSLQLISHLELSYNGIIDRLNILSRYQNKKASLKDLKRESNQLLREAKKETDIIKSNLLWAVMYAISSVKRKSNLEYAFYFLIVALASELSKSEIDDALANLKI
ncbi:hypothetical protein LJC17_01250 [Acholeplasma sp. OttesenSCG-928-E16]|nr:hypothetical protein [Acholeplasma sp. OttesenSCG-928-E16]